MLSPTQAIKNALATTRNDVGMCDKWVAQYYGYSSSGYATAIAHWRAIPATDKHPGDTNPPAGALVFWSGGSSGAGHVALSLGGGNVVSTDYPRSGMTSRTTINAISNGWGESYQGWATPVFQGQISQASFPSSPVSGLGNILGGGGTVLDMLTGGFGTDIKDLLERAGLILLGAALVIVGIIRMQSKNIGAVLGSANKAKKTSVKETANAADETGTQAEKEIGNGVREIER